MPQQPGAALQVKPEPGVAQVETMREARARWEAGRGAGRAHQLGVEVLCVQQRGAQLERAAAQRHVEHVQVHLRQNS